MRHLLRVLLCLPLLLGSPFSMRAQAPGLVLSFPRDGLTNVERRPTITVRTPAPIIPESITFGYPDADHHGYAPTSPTVLLMAEPFDGERADRIRRTVLGTYALVDPHTLTFTPTTLEPNTRYRIEVSGIDVDANGPVRLATMVSVFTTAAEIPRVMGTNLQGRPTIGCSDTITVQFSGDVLPALGDPQRWIRLETMDSTTVWQPVPCAVFTSGEHVHILPDGRWPSGAILRLHVDMHATTGDTLDNRTFSTVVRSAGRLQIDVVEQDGETVPDDVREDFERYQQMVADGPPDVGSIDRREDLWRFVRWESPLLTPRDPDAPSGSDVTIDCTLLHDVIPLTAILDHADSVPITVTAQAGGVVNVYSYTNTLIAVVTDTLQMSYDPSEGGLRVVVLPDSGYRFAGWQAPGTSMHGSASAAFVVNSSMGGSLFQAWQQGTFTPTFNAQFTPQVGGTETYALKGAIQDWDADPGFDVNDGVHFTTEYEFEEAVPGQRTICVRAEPCWKIVGYSESARNIYELFDPVETYCVTAPLTDPENHVVFFAQRTTINLRVEQVVLASDEPNDILPGRDPHPETYVRVDKRVTAQDGTSSWRALVPVPCKDGDLLFNGYGLKCGDVVRMRTRGSSVRGQVWKYFDTRPLYAIPDPAGKSGDEYRYEMVIDEDIANFTATDCRGLPSTEPQIRVRACFRQDFGVDAIGMTVRTVHGSDRGDATWEERWYDPVYYRPLADDEPRGGRQLEYRPRFGTEIKIRFTMPIDVRTIYDGGLKAVSYGNVLVTDPLLTGLDFTVSSSDNEHISFEPTDGSPITTVVFRICDPETSPRMQALHFGEIAASALTGVRSLSGQPLAASYSFLLSSMELPAYGLLLRDATYAYDGDWDFIFPNKGEMYHVTYGGNLGWEKAHEVNTAFRRLPDCREQQGVVPGECTLPHSDKDGPQRYGDMMQWMQPHWMDHTDLAWWQISSYDEDCKDENDCLVNRAQDLLDMLKEKIGEYGSEDPEAPVLWPSILPDLLQLGTEFIQDLLPPDDQDDHVGYGTFLTNNGDWWGIRSATSPLVVLDQSNTRYRLLARFFLQRAVIR